MGNGSLGGDSIYASLASPENKHSFAFTAIGKRQTFTLHKVMKISFVYLLLLLYIVLSPKKRLADQQNFKNVFAKWLSDGCWPFA